MNIPSPSPAYDPQNEAAARQAIEQEDRRNVKAGADITFAGDALAKNPRLIIKSPNGTLYRVLVNNAGALSTVAV